MARDVNYIQALAKARESGHLFILNKTVNAVGRAPGNLVTQVNANGMTHEVVIPATWVPVDLGLFAPVSAVVDDPRLRRFLVLGYAEIVDEEEAMKVLSSPAARDELNRVMSKQARDTEGAIAASANDAAINSQLPQQPMPVTVVGDTSNDGLGMDVFLRYRSGEITEESCISALKAVGSLITDPQLGLMISMRTTPAINKALHEIQLDRSTVKAA